MHYILYNIYMRDVTDLGRRDDDGVAGVDPERVEVFHVANGDAVVVLIANNLVLDLCVHEFVRLVGDR